MNMQVSPLAREWHEARKARLARMAPAAKPIALFTRRAPAPVVEKPKKTKPKPIGIAWLYPSPIGPVGMIGRDVMLVATDAFKTSRMVARIVAQSIAKHTNVSEAEIMSEIREAHVVRCRQEIWYRIRKETTWSLTRSGRYFGKDHTTVLSGIRAHARRLANGTAL